MRKLFETNYMLRSLLNTNSLILFLGASVIAGAYSCSSTSAAPENYGAMPAPQLPVFTVTSTSATTHSDYAAALEGKVNVEIRPQVEGYLEKIYVDEGAYVKAGQPLFKINDREYDEDVKNAKSSLAGALANIQKAQVEIDRLTPLVEGNVISDVQLKTAKAAHAAAVAAADQAKAQLGNAQINIGYTLIKAPVSGYVGRFPYKTGSLVGKGEAEPLTLLSDVSEIYAYFTLSEPDFIAFKKQFAGNTIEEKLKNAPPVELLLADNSVYEQKGKLETIEGQFDKTMGTITFRAAFPNAGRTLRTGNTGKVRIPQLLNNALIVPQEATFEVQDKVFVYAVGDSNKVASKPISISGKTSAYYFVSDGVKAGEKIVLSGTGNLTEGAAIVPQVVSTDSLLKVKPL